jgi:hypothetical protein
LETNLEHIISSDFGTIRQVYFNKFVGALLIETEYGFQFILKDGEIIAKNIGRQFKIIGNTFKQREITFITQYGLHKSNIEKLIVKTTTDIWWVQTQYYYHQITQKLNFPFFQYFSAHIKSIQNSDIILLADDFKGIVSYNVLSEDVEFSLAPDDKPISTIFNSNEVKEIYWLSVDKFEISEDEKYFYVITAYEGKSIFVFRTEDCSLLYHEIGSYALSIGLFDKDKFIIPSGYDYDADDKQPFKIIDLIDGSVDIINKNSDKLEDIHFGAKFKDLFIGYNLLSNSEVYNYERNFIAINIKDIIYSKTIAKKEISIEPKINFENSSLKDIFIQDNYLIALTWNNSISIHSITQKEENYMDELINSIHSELADYRADEENPDVQMSPDKIRLWINQFEEGLRIPILTELDNIFKKRYCSKKDIKSFLEAIVEKLSEDFKFSTPQELIRNSDFLNLQPVGKSQRIMLRLFDELIQEKYGLSLDDCGTISKRYSIYIDDILCTGLTMVSDIKEWSEQNFSANKTNGQAVADNSTTLVFAYVFIHEKNYQKKVAEMRHKISNDVYSKHKMYSLIEIENGVSQSSKIDLIFPLEEGQTDRVKEYQAEITNRVDQRANEKGWKTGPNEFYRPVNLPTNEGFFTTVENRKIVENAFLQKGIQILNNANSQIPNMRALGYSLPSLKDFGFGALCFTWRNVPNNAPLVFWYSGGGFTPLFKVTRGGNPIGNFNFVANPTTPDDDLLF